MIHPYDIRGIHCLIPNNEIQNLNINNNFVTTHHHHQQQLNVVPCNSSTSDEAEEHQISMIDEKKQRRMISNRESARRSRMRKKRHMDELRSLVVRLRTENHNLVRRLKQVSESHDRVLQENAKLKEEASDLRQMVDDLQNNGSSSAIIAFIDFDESPCNFY